MTLKMKTNKKQNIFLLSKEIKTLSIFHGKSSNSENTFSFPNGNWKFSHKKILKTHFLLLFSLESGFQYLVHAQGPGFFGHGDLGMVSRVRQTKRLVSAGPSLARPQLKSVGPGRHHLGVWSWQEECQDPLSPSTPPLHLSPCLVWNAATPPGILTLHFISSKST